MRLGKCSEDGSPAFTGKGILILPSVQDGLNHSEKIRAARDIAHKRKYGSGVKHQLNHKSTKRVPRPPQPSPAMHRMSVPNKNENGGNAK